MKRPVEDGLSLLVGAGVGMALMYLLDPAEGSDRREQIQRGARERLSQAQNAASAGLGHLHEVVDRAAGTPAVHTLAAKAAEAARGVYDEVTGHATATANEFGRQATGAAEGLRSKVASKIDELRGHANDLSSEARNKYGARDSSWLNRSSRALGRDEDHHYIGQTACALGSLAIGAGAVYLFDPDEGAKRRAQLVDRATYAVRETGDFFRKAGRRLVTRGRAVARDATERAQDVASDVASHFQPSGENENSQPVTESTEASMGT